jgi:hypothetical protein
MDHPIPVEELSPEIARACGPSAPAPVKLMAARGMMPMAHPGDLVTTLYMLAHDANETLRSAATDTFAGLPPEVLQSAFAGDIDPRVLDFAADRFLAKESMMIPILRNTRTDDDTLERLASVLGESLLEIIAANETRLLRRPAIIEALYLNKRTRMSTVDRVIEFAVRHGLVLDGIPAFKEIAAAVEGQLVMEPQEEASPDDALFAATVAFEDDGEGFSDFEGAGGSGFGDFDRLDDPRKTEKKAGEGDGKRAQLGFQLSQMTVSQKIRIAVLGNASHRSMLLRDPNKLVAMAAIKSPAVTDQEVGMISQSRSVSEEVVRYIADNRDWTKNYIVKVNLVNNPKCPLAHSLRFLSHLRTGELRALVGNKNIPAALGSAARQMIQRKQQAAGGGG